MAETQIKLNGLNGVIALVLVVCFMVFRVVFMLETKDAVIIDQIKSYLASDLGNALQSEISKGTSNLEELAKYTSSNIEIYSVKMSSPLLSLNSKEKVILQVEYKMPNADKKIKKFFRCSYFRATNNLRFLGETSIVSFYLNFI